MNVLVSGGTGRVGANFIKRLTSCGAGIRALVAPRSPNFDKLSQFPDISVTEGDLSDQEAINRACDGVTHIVHLAARLVRGNTPVDRFYDINALGTLRLLEGAARTGTVERFILASSDGTYRPGAPSTVPLTENSPQHPADYYGTSKLLAEIILRNHALQYDIPYSIIRFATVVSPEEAPQMFRLSFWKQLLGLQANGKDSHLWPLFDNQPNFLDALAHATHGTNDNTAVGLTGPDGTPWTLSFIDVRDAVEGLCSSLTHPAALNNSFNIAQAHPTSHEDAANAIAEVFNVPKVMVPMPVTWHLEFDIGKARAHLDYRPQHNFRTTLRDGATDHADKYIPVRSDTGVSAWTSSS